ncbi:MAG: lytic transglycosylase, partial [Terracidiphilus sp.]
MKGRYPLTSNSVRFFAAVLRWSWNALALVLCALMAIQPVVAQTSSTTDAKRRKEPANSTSAGTNQPRPATAHKHAPGKKTAAKAKSHRRPVHRGSRAARMAHTARIHRAFVASTELRPMGQQLALLRTPQAYEGVAAYAHSHTGEAAAAAYLALGHAYLLDKRYAEASSSLSLALKSGQELADYDDFLGAEVDHAAGNDAAAEALLKGFAGRYPDSIFVDREPELEANVFLSLNNPAA